MESLFTSACFAILETRHDMTAAAKVTPCGVDDRYYTTGCRILGQKVSECRNSNDGNVCGVMVDNSGSPPACPVPNSCVGDKLSTNIGIDSANCVSTTHLALNVFATADNCSRWSAHSFLMDGMCVSSCGVLDYQCVLGGVAIPPCTKTVTGLISPDICSVPMRADRYGGVRNGFFGMSVMANTQCLFSTNCTNSSQCQVVEGINVSDAHNFSKTNALPTCRGNLTEFCKIGHPCPIPIPPFTCSGFNIKVSEAIWTSMGVYNCALIQVFDVFIFVFFIWFMFRFVSIMNSQGGEDPTDTQMCFMTLVIFGLSLVWQFVLPIYLVLEICLFWEQRSRSAEVAAQKKENAAAVRMTEENVAAVRMTKENVNASRNSGWSEPGRSRRMEFEVND